VVGLDVRVPDAEPRDGRAARRHPSRRAGRGGRRADPPWPVAAGAVGHLRIGLRRAGPHAGLPVFRLRRAVAGVEAKRGRRDRHRAVRERAGGARAPRGRGGEPPRAGAPRRRARPAASSTPSISRRAGRRTIAAIASCARSWRTTRRCRWWRWATSSATGAARRWFHANAAVAAYDALLQERVPREITPAAQPVPARDAETCRARTAATRAPGRPRGARRRPRPRAVERTLQRAAVRQRRRLEPLSRASPSRAGATTRCATSAARSSTSGKGRPHACARSRQRLPRGRRDVPHDFLGRRGRVRIGNRRPPRRR
jgi:hypothetical protein